MSVTIPSVAHNREIVQQQIGVPVAYLNQIHSNKVVLATDALERLTDADASVDNTGRAACASMTADCLPVLFADKAGTVLLLHMRAGKAWRAGYCKILFVR